MCSSDLPTGTIKSQFSSEPQGECLHSPQGSGATVGYREKGYPKRKPKNGSDPKQKLARQTGSQLRSPIRPRPPRRGRFTRGPSPRPQKNYRFSDSPEAPSPRPLHPRPLAKASEEVPILRLARGPLAAGLGRPPAKGLGRPLLSSQGSAGPPILRLARGGQGSTPLPLPPPVPLTKRRVALT